MNVIRYYIYLVLLLLSQLCFGQIATIENSGKDLKKISLFNTSSELTRDFENVLHEQIDKIILKSDTLMTLRANNVKVVPLLWQSYLWLEYDLCEEVALLVAITTDTGETRNMLIRATRSPYRAGFQRWMVEWAADDLFDGSPRYEWEVINIEKLKTSGLILKWCKDRSFFERVASVGNPLIQRWIFNYNWERVLGRGLNKQELNILLRTKPPANIVVPLPDNAIEER